MHWRGRVVGTVTRHTDETGEPYYDAWAEADPDLPCPCPSLEAGVAHILVQERRRGQS